MFKRHNTGLLDSICTNFDYISFPTVLELTEHSFSDLSSIYQQTIFLCNVYFIAQTCTKQSSQSRCINKINEACLFFMHSMIVICIVNNIWKARPDMQNTNNNIMYFWTYLMYTTVFLITFILGFQQYIFFSWEKSFWSKTDRNIYYQ